MLSKRYHPCFLYTSSKCCFEGTSYFTSNNVFLLLMLTLLRSFRLSPFGRNYSYSTEEFLKMEASIFFPPHQLPTYVNDQIFVSRQTLARYLFPLCFSSVQTSGRTVGRWSTLPCQSAASSCATCSLYGRGQR